MFKPQRLLGQLVLIVEGLTVALASDVPGMQIASPAEGELMRPGEVVTVVLDVDPQLNPRSVLFYSSISLEDAPPVADSDPPYSATFRIPRSYIGRLQIETAVIQDDAEGTLLDGPSTYFNVLPTDSPVRLEIGIDGPLKYVDGVGAVAHVSVTGIYADGSRRFLSDRALGTTYESDTPAVATVTADGQIQATGVGKAVISVDHNGIRTFVVATVSGELGVPVPVAVDVSASVRISAGGYRFDPETRRYVQEVWIVNTSDRPIPLPLDILVTNLPDGVELRNRKGLTQHAEPLGSAFIGVRIQAERTLWESYLAPGATASATLEFMNPYRIPIVHELRLFRGGRM